jgi:hypothetical protein
MRDPSSFDNDLDAFVFPYEARDDRAASDWIDATVDRFGRLDVL